MNNSRGSLFDLHMDLYTNYRLQNDSVDGKNVFLAHLALVTMSLSRTAASFRSFVCSFVRSFVRSSFVRSFVHSFVFSQFA